MIKISTEALILLMTIMICPILSNLEVYTPECARKTLPLHIKYNLANFGYIPFGQSYIGQVYLPKQGNEQLCKIQNQFIFKIGESLIKTILLVKRGKCKFTQKVLNAQKLGANYVLIYDNETSTRPIVIMKNDGHGHLVTIPSAFISHSDGLSLITAINTCNQQIYLKQNFQVFESQIVDLRLWLNLNNRESYVLLRDFYDHDYYNVIDQYVNISVRFNVKKGCDIFTCNQRDCIGTGLNKYCMPMDSTLKDLLTGADILKQSLRMYNLFYTLPKNKQYVWFQYMNLFDKNLCLQIPAQIQQCSYQAMKKSGASNEMIDKIKKNITDTLTQLREFLPHTDNILYHVVTEADQKNIVFYPEAVINGKNFYGLFKAPEVFEMVCNSLISQPKECYSFIKNKTSSQIIDKTDGVWLTVLFIILLMTMGFFVALFIYTKLIKNEVNQQISMQVNKMVQNYVTLTQQSSIGSKRPQT